AIRSRSVVRKLPSRSRRRLSVRRCRTSATSACHRPGALDVTDIGRAGQQEPCPVLRDRAAPPLRCAAPAGSTKRGAPGRLSAPDRRSGSPCRGRATRVQSTPPRHAPMRTPRPTAPPPPAATAPPRTRPAATCPSIGRQLAVLIWVLLAPIVVGFALWVHAEVHGDTVDAVIARVRGRTHEVAGILDRRLHTRMEELEQCAARADVVHFAAEPTRAPAPDPESLLRATAAT